MMTKTLTIPKILRFKIVVNGTKFKPTKLRLCYPWLTKLDEDNSRGKLSEAWYDLNTATECLVSRLSSGWLVYVSVFGFGFELK